MANAFELRLDMRPWERALQQLGRQAPNAIARALNKTGNSVRAQMAREVAKDMGIKVGAAREAITVVKATPTSLAVRVTARGRPIPLINFNAKGPQPSRGKGRGVSYTMQSQRKTLTHAFIASVGSGGHRGVFVRSGRRRLPIRELHGPSIARVFGKLTPVGERKASEALMSNLTHEIDRELSRITG